MAAAPPRQRQQELVFANLLELEALARARVPAASWGYLSGGADGEETLAANRAALAAWRLLPRALVDVSRVDTSTRLLGRRVAAPILVAPMAMHRLYHPDGEVAVAAGAAAAGVPMVVSTMATASAAEVAAAAPPGATLWFQLYVLSRRDVVLRLVRAAEAAGYTALCVTVDAPRLGRREADERSGFALLPGLRLPNVEAALGGGGGNSGGASGGGGSRFGRQFGSLIDASLTWDVIPWLKGITKLPVLVKGVLAPDDARRAVAAGADGVVVSNHGGRQLDGVPAAADVLPRVAAAVARRVPVLADGGVRRGTDVVKLLCLGADAVLVGRPVLWALAAGGAPGVQAALRRLRGEVELAMALLGCPAIAGLGLEYLVEPPGGPARLPAARL